MFVDFCPRCAVTIASSQEINQAACCYNLGVTCASDLDHADLVEAHKWFNLAAYHGDVRGAAARSWVAETMTLSEVAEAQRRARRHDGEPFADAHHPAQLYDRRNDEVNLHEVERVVS